MAAEDNKGDVADINAKPRARSVASPKRTISEHRGLHAWHPYYAGFSEAFVSDILSEIGVKRNHIVLDPMNGSGTTTVVAQQHGCLSIGVELNPAMAIIARSKDATFGGHPETVELAGEIVRRAARRRTIADSNEFTEGWIPKKTLSQLRRLDTEISNGDRQPLLPLDLDLARLLGRAEQPPGGRNEDFLRAALLVTARRASSAEGSKNPTWLKPGTGNSNANTNVFKEFLAIAAAMMEDIDETFKNKPPARQLMVLEADARSQPLPEKSVDAIVTSPPYLTRIDYAVGTAPELVLLGTESEEELREVRRTIMGSTCVTGGPYRMQRCWGKICLDIIDQVRRHDSKASSGYYLKTHIQYFRDAEAILRECLRVLKPGASAIFVVQDSWYKDIHIPLDKIYREMAMELGAAAAETINSEAVRNHLGMVNTRSRQYQKGLLHEHVVLFRRR